MIEPQSQQKVEIENEIGNAQRSKIESIFDFIRDQFQNQSPNVSKCVEPQDKNKQTQSQRKEKFKEGEIEYGSIIKDEFNRDKLRNSEKMDVNQEMNQFHLLIQSRLPVPENKNTSKSLRINLDQDLPLQSNTPTNKHLLSKDLFLIKQPNISSNKLSSHSDLLSSLNPNGNCPECQEKKNVIHRYCNRLMLMNEKEVELRKQIVSLTIENKNIQMTYESKCKQIEEIQREFEDMIKLINQRRAWMEEEEQYLNNQIFKRQDQAIQTHLKMMHNLINSHTSLDKIEKNNRVEIMKLIQIDMVNKHMFGKKKLEKEVQEYIKLKNSCERECEEVVAKIARIQKSNKLKQQFYQSKIMRMIDEISDLKSENEKYEEQISQLENQAHKLRIELHQKQTKHGMDNIKLIEEIWSKSIRIQELEQLYE